MKLIKLMKLLAKTPLSTDGASGGFGSGGICVVLSGRRTCVWEQTVEDELGICMRRLSARFDSQDASYAKLDGDELLYKYT